VVQTWTQIRKKEEEEGNKDVKLAVMLRKIWKEKIKFLKDT
jgi:hypothetical protein